MRILANYGSRENGSSYNVTFETTGDVKMEQAEETVDELFRLAREAVQRQMEGKDLEFPPKDDRVTIPRVASNGNGAQATQKQRAFLRKLNAGERKGVDVDSLTKQEASSLISELMEV
jgi:hypothetical protein